MEPKVFCKLYSKCKLNNQKLVVKQGEEELQTSKYSI